MGKNGPSQRTRENKAGRRDHPIIYPTQPNNRRKQNRAPTHLERELLRHLVRPVLPARDDVVEHGEVQKVGVGRHAVVQHDLHPARTTERKEWSGGGHCILDDIENKSFSYVTAKHTHTHTQTHNTHAPPLPRLAGPGPAPHAVRTHLRDLLLQLLGQGHLRVDDPVDDDGEEPDRHKGVGGGCGEGGEMVVVVQCMGCQADQLE